MNNLAWITVIGLAIYISYKYNSSTQLTVTSLHSTYDFIIDYHGNHGPLAVSDGTYTQLSDIFLKAGQELGFKTGDCNGKEQIGFCSMQSTIKNGVRHSTYEAFLKPAMKRSNFHVSVNSFATKIIIENKKAVGVEFIKNGRKTKVFANKEVILSGGSVNSPQLLMLSGIGPKQHLDDLGIDVIEDLPVGENLQDHLLLPLYLAINESISLTIKEITSVTSVLKYFLFKKGPLTTAALEGTAFLNKDGTTTDNGKAADIQLHFQNLDYLKPELKKDIHLNMKQEVEDAVFITKPEQQAFMILPIVLHPKSRGVIRLKSRDPFDYPLIDPHYLTASEDVEMFLNAIRFSEKLVATNPLMKIGASFDNPSPFYQLCADYKFRSDEFWTCYVRNLAWTIFHSTSSCRMGRIDDPTAVVDPSLRVKGIANLRVVDASVMRNVPSGNTNAPAIMIAEKAADLIRDTDSVKAIRQAIKHLF